MICGTSNFLQISNVKNKVHPTQKPVDLMKILVENSSNERRYYNGLFYAVLVQQGLLV